MADEPLTLEALQRDLLLPELDTFLAAAPDAAGRELYLALRDALSALSVPPALVGRLELVTELLLTSGKARRAHGPAADLALWALFQKTPRGRALLESVATLNTALKRLEGQTLEFVSAVARAPGVYAITLKSGGLQLVLRFDSAGARVESVDVG
ncbi:MAG: hypothetical protein ACLQJ0_13710 [Steroidobacteraceae bacterium]